jgi:Tat protein secretion system quality control protein TatD with DNase activity
VVYIELVARRIAEIKAIDFNEVVQQTTQNALSLVGLKS